MVGLSCLALAGLLACGDGSVEGDGPSEGHDDAAPTSDVGLETSVGDLDAGRLPDGAPSPIDAVTPDGADTKSPGGDTGPSIDAGPAPHPARGAALPYDEYEAESATTTGTLLGPSRVFGDLATEASGRRAVKLTSSGNALHFTSKHVANSIVVRYAIPDAPGGGGLSGSLAIYVDGVHRTDLALTSKYAWIYGGESGSSSNDPKTGGAHHFYDESRALVGEIPAGATVELRKEAKDTSEFIVVDLVDLEEVAPALAMPADAFSIVDYGAKAGDGADDGPAIEKCIVAARGAGKSVFIPSGTFESTSGAIDVQGVSIGGAGMWYSELRGFFARFRCTGNGCRYRDFAVTGETTLRDDGSPESAFLGGAGTGSSLTNIWVEHEKTGYWVGDSPTDGLLIHGCRFRDLFADGVNLCNGASHSIVEESHARNTGDDAFASWSPTSSGGVNVGNVFRWNTVQLPWRANCYAIYGGQDNRIEDSTCADVVEYPGVLLAQQFGSHAFAGTTSVARVTLTRAGGPMYGQQHGALKLQAFDTSMRGFSVRDVDIVDATFSGIHLQGKDAIDGLTLENVNIGGAGTFGVFIDGDAHGTATATNVVVTGAASGGSKNAAGGAFVITRGAGNVGW